MMPDKKQDTKNEVANKKTAAVVYEACNDITQASLVQLVAQDGVSKFSKEDDCG